MTSRPVMAFSAVTMIVGVGLGLWWDQWSAPTMLNAGPTDSDTIPFGENTAVYGLEQGGKNLAKVARTVMPTVVHIQSRRNTARGRVEETGSGAIITSARQPGAFVVTNRHVIQGAKLSDIIVQLYDGREYSPQKVWKDKETDIAVLKLPITNVKSASWGNSDRLEIGHFVVAVGSPFGLSRSMTLGIISAKGRRSLSLGEKSDVINQNFLQTDAAINPGNSGGPLIDLKGEIIGINTAIASNSGGNDGIGFSIPSNLARRVVDQLLAYGRVRRGYLGVKLDPDFDMKTASRLGLEKPRGARIIEIYPNTPAARAKLKVNDVILSFNGRAVEDENDLINQVSMTPIGTRVNVDVVRNGRKTRTTVVLSDRTELGKRDSTSPPRFSGVPVQPMSLELHSLGQALSHGKL